MDWVSVQAQERRDATNARSRVWRSNNKEKAKKWVADWDARNPGRKAFLSQRGKIMKMYGLDQQQAEVVMVEQQGGICTCCGKYGRLVVDHNHTTGAARGMVCYRCNQIAGAIEDPAYPLVQAHLERTA